MSAPAPPRPPRLLRAGALAFVALVALAYGGQSLARVWQMMGEVAALERELAALRAETEDLGARIDRLRTDPEYVEQLAREGLGMVRPGERVLRLPPRSGG